MAILTIVICSAITAVLFLMVAFNCLSESALCKLILLRMKFTNTTPQAIVERAVSFDGESAVYSYEKYRALTSIYDDVTDIYIPVGHRRVSLELFEACLAEQGKAYAPNQKGAEIITI